MATAQAVIPPPPDAPGAIPPPPDAAAPKASGDPAVQRGLDWGALPTTGDVMTHGGGAILDTMGLGRGTARTPKGVVLNPQSMDEHLASLAVTIPAYYAMPGGALGRVALGAAQGGAAGQDRGESAGQMATSAGISAATAGLLEGLGALVRGAPRVGLGARAKPVEDAAKEMTRRTSAFDAAAESPKAMYAELAARLPKGPKLMVPTLSSKPMTAKDAVEKLSTLKGEDWIQARAEIAKEFNRLDIGKYMTTPTGGFLKVPRASQAGGRFARNVPRERFDPPQVAVPDAAKRAAKALKVAEGAQPAATAAAEDPEEGLPRGFPLMGLIPYLKNMIPGVHVPLPGGGH